MAKKRKQKFRFDAGNCMITLVMISFTVITIQSLFGFFKLLPVIDHTKMIFIYSVCCFFVIYLIYGIFLVQTMLIATNKLERMSVSAGRDGVSVEGDNEQKDSQQFVEEEVNNV